MGPKQGSAPHDGSTTRPSAGALPAHAGSRGWDSVVRLPAGSIPPSVLSNQQIAQALQPVPGGRALTTSLVNILILDDGRIFAGMVPLDRLESAAAAG
ncbi:hypothetical protein AAHB33_09950 [Paenarthrobacter sp. S56]|uniref:hypothetical protein n=1 Tax=Paenarthrobacter sp. S56 TaxID=3138179 RepID=UPI00321B5379